MLTNCHTLHITHLLLVCFRQPSLQKFYRRCRSLTSSINYCLCFACHTLTSFTLHYAYCTKTIIFVALDSAHFQSTLRHQHINSRHIENLICCVYRKYMYTLYVFLAGLLRKETVSHTQPIKV